MKHFLILLSSFTISTILTNTFANFNQNTTFIDNLETNNNENKNLFINNKYDYLSDSDWITNQSIADHKFYSYDTNHADYKLISGINARNIFFVDADGKLQYDSNLILEKDKADIENTKQEMISDKKITTVKDGYNPYSKSEYSNSYFSGDNTNWQYVQLGGVEKNIDISKQAGADKVDITSLSETLGLYYIAKAAHENKITKAVAYNLGIYFISQSSLKEKINNKLIIKIIDLIIDNNEIYKLIFNDKENKDKPIFTNNDKNNSLNLIFDNDNNLIKIYYNIWNHNNIKNNLNYHYYNWSAIIFGTAYNSSDTYNLLNWKKYAHDWDTFTKIFPTVNFDNNSYVNLGWKNESWNVHISNLTTNIILTNKGSGNTNSVFNVQRMYSIGNYFSREMFFLNIWHDNENIYFKWFLNNIEAGSEYTINFNDLNFINIMN